ncbi:MAG: nucleotidyltransferase domain-containing protein, partial [bacterium]
LVVLAAVPGLQALLRERGFRVTEGKPPTCFVMRNDKGVALDFHPLRWDENSNARYRMENGEDWVYPGSGLAGSGSIAGRPVRCVTAEMQVMDHQDYELKEKDFRDMEALHDRFGVALPPVLVRGRDGDET